MSLETIIQENTIAIRELIAALAHGITPTAAQVAAVTGKPVDEAPTKPRAEKAAPAPKAEPALQPEPEPTPEPASFPDTPSYSYMDAAAAITKLSRTKGRDAAVALLYKFKASKLPEVQPDDYAEIIEAANAAMGA